MAKRMTEDELRALTDSEMRNSVGYAGGKLSEMRRKAEYYYLGLAEGDLTPPEVEGRSAVVSPDVRNTIESMLPQLMVKFTGGDSVVEFEPTKAGDDAEQEAKSITDYLNYIFFKKNNGHSVTYTMFKDALLQKRGIVKVWWDDRHEETKEDYQGLSDVELSQLLDDDELTPVSHSTRPDEDDAKQRQQAIEQLTQQLQQAMQAAGQPGQQGSSQQPPGMPPAAPAPAMAPAGPAPTGMPGGAAAQLPANQQAAQAAQQIQAQIQHIQSLPPVMLHDIEVKRSKTGGKVTIEPVPPEEFLISRKAKNIATASFVGHRVPRTLSDLRSMGYKNIDNISSDDVAAEMNAERIERLSFDDEQAYLNVDVSSTDESQRQVWLTECYVRCDFDGDGISELRKVVRAGNQILENEVVDVVPFVSVCPVPLPHKFFGLSIADLAFDSQLTKTALLRAKIDNTFLQVNGRYFAIDGQVNLDDLLTSRPGGVVRIKQPGAVGRLDQGAMDGSADSMLEYMEQFLESSTGWTRMSQGMNAGSLQGTATGMNIVTNKDDMRLDLIARNFAEGFCDLFKLMLKLVCQHQHEPVEIKLNGAWMSVDPTEWRNEYDVSINVGLGVGNKDQRVQHLMALSQKQEAGLQIGVATPENVYNANVELAKELGYKTVDKFFTDPSKQPPRPPPPPPYQVQVEQMKQQGEAQHNQFLAQAEQQKIAMQDQQHQREIQRDLDVERMKQSMEMQQQTALNQLEAQRDELKARLDAQVAQHQATLDAQREADRLAFDKWKAELEASVKIQVALITAKTSINNAQMATDTASAVDRGINGNA